MIARGEVFTAVSSSARMICPCAVFYFADPRCPLFGSDFKPEIQILPSGYIPWGFLGMVINDS